MIPNQEKIVNIHGNVEDSVSRQMGLDSQSLPHLMSVLANLYSDSEMAVIREYSTNAYDSHVEAGRADMPIQVTLPTVFSPEFVVRDFGVGMDETEVFEVFGMYGASTKRESNDFTGQLGLGCKSGFSMTNQFSLTAIKNGFKRIFSVHLDEYGVGRITKLFEERTDAGNGVEVSIPVNNVTSFVRKAKLFYRFFPTLPEFVGGVAFPHEMVPEVIMQIDDNTRIIRRVSEDEGKDFVVMGGVAYPYRHNGYTTMIHSGTVVMNAPMGAVDFTPSREELNLSKRTLDFIEQRKSIIYAQIEARINEELSKAKTLVEYKKILREFNRDLYALGKFDFQFQGQKVNLRSLDNISFNTLVTKLEYNTSSNRLSKTTQGELWDSHHLSTYALIRAEEDDLRDADIKKIRTWMIQNKTYTTVVIPGNSKLHPDYVAKFGLEITLEEIKASVKHVAKTAKKSVMYDRVVFNSYGYRSHSSVEYVKEIPDETTQIYYVGKKLLKSVFTGSRYSPSNPQVDVPVYAIADNQVAKFLKAYPKAKPFVEALIDKFEDAVNRVYADQNEILSVARSKLSYNLLYLSLPADFTKINDPELARFIQIAVSEKRNDSAYAESKRLYDLLSPFSDTAVGANATRLRNLINRRDTVGKKEADEATALYAKLSGKYPLLLTKHSQEQHLIDYANMIAKGA